MLLRACDIDKKIPATTYTLTAGDGRSISKDLCAEHAEPFEEWLEEAEAVEEAPEPAPAKPVKKAAARRRRPAVTTLSEIEAKKS